jgi:DNA-binding transcriptional ArsR family regulator
MNDLENSLLKISEQLKELNNKINFLQDTILIMKSEMELIKKSNVQGNKLMDLTKIADENIATFLDNRPKDCQILDYCTTLMEKGTFRILRTLMEKGNEAAINKINKYINFSESSAASKACPSKECLKNATNIFRILKDLVIDSKELSLRYLEELKILDEESFFDEGSEKEVFDLLTPLSNVIRLKILKYLSKGGKLYSELEEEMGIKAGHLLFHINKLIEKRYLVQENKKYLITTNGLKALKLLNELKKELTLIS